MWALLLLSYIGRCIAGPASDSSIVHFPDGAEQIRNKKDLVGLSRQIDTGFIQPCPNYQDFCENTADYPWHIKVSPAVALHSLVRDKLFSTKPKPSFRVGEIPQDFEDFVEETQACRYRRSVVYPKKAKNTNGEFMFIVNKDEYKQSVGIEQCEGEGQPCETDGDAPQMNVGSTVCRQKFTTYKLYAINHDGKQIYDSFSLPSACLCYHKSKFSNFGLNNLFRSNIRSTNINSLPICPSENQKEPFENLVDMTKLTSKRTDRRALRKQKRIDRRRSRQRRPSFKANACKSGMFCTSDRNYPYDAMLSVLKQDKQLTDKLYKEVFNSECKEAKNVISRRFLPSEEALCPSRPKVIYPRKALNLRNEWMYIVNLDKYTQSVEIEVCVDQTNGRQISDYEYQGSKFGVCLYGGAEGQDPDSTVCRQKYTEHKLLAFTADSELLVDSFKLPSACACYIKDDFDFDLEIRQDFGFRRTATNDKGLHFSAGK